MTVRNKTFYVSALALLCFESLLSRQQGLVFLRVDAMVNVRGDLIRLVEREAELGCEYKNLVARKRVL